MGVQLIGVPNKMQCLQCLWSLSHNEVSFSTNSLCLRVAQMPRSRNLVIFVSNDNR